MIKVTEKLPVSFSSVPDSEPGYVSSKKYCNHF